MALTVLTLGCSSAAPPKRGGTDEPDADEPAPVVKKDAAVDKAPPSGGSSGSGGSAGSGGSGSGGSAGSDAGSGGSGPGDAGADAYVRTMGGPFGLEQRPAKQTCKAPADPDKPIDKLSATGCVDAMDPKKPAPSTIPYDVASPLWSDGAAKLRYLAVPDGALIHVKDCMREPAACQAGGTTDDDGHWELPVGTVLVKHFQFNAKFLETRLYVRFADKWVGYSYEWNATQTDATIVDVAGVRKQVVGVGGKMQEWYFPSRQDCNTCHNDAVGFTLGPETLQMNRPFMYGTVMANQIQTLEHIGLFDAPVRTTNLDGLPLPTLTGTPQTLEARARSYMHANCAICHRPGGEYPAIDLRWGTPLKDMNICNVDQNKGDVGVPTSKRMVPGMPMQSTMYLRVKSVDKATRMPQLATSVVDDVGSKLIFDWITATKVCP